MLQLAPVVLEGFGIRLEPMQPSHREAIIDAASDGELWNLWFTTVPAPEDAEKYIQTALDGLREGHMLPWVVRDLTSDKIVGSTRYHDVISSVDRVEIGYTFYAKSFQKTHLNTVCKLLLLTHAFETLGCKVVGLRTDNFNFNSQQAIEKLGAKKDGVIRHHWMRKDGTVRDTVLYSILLEEWPEVRRHLEARLARLQSNSPVPPLGPPEKHPRPSGGEGR